ncbi:MAG: tetratricopeptide repeat protein [Myxococcaceae bacterium]
MDCPDEDLLLDFLEGRVAPERAGELGAHTESCRSCRRALVALERLRSADGLAPTVTPGSTAPDPGHEIRAGATLGRYVVRERVGAGAMGVVYAAHDPALDRKVALKLLHPERDAGTAAEELRARLDREGRVMARLRHPNVITVHDVGTFEGRSFVAMEFVEGHTLRQWLSSSPRTPPEVLACLLEAGRGLAAAHAEGLVHRDFKPDNVLVERTGRVVVTDFGLASEPDHLQDPYGAVTDLTAHASTRTGALVGTPAYMAPEQLEGASADPRCDQFSFCVTAFEALGGTRPFSGKTLSQLGECIRAGRPDVAAAARIPPRALRVLERGLSARPEDRFPSMEALLEALAPPARAGSRLVVTGGLVLLAAIAAGAYGLSRARLCSGAANHLAGTWDASRRTAVHASMVATGLPFAEASWKDLEKGLDLWAGAWAASWTQACEATRVRGGQSEDLLDLRMSCLDERLAEVRALTGLYSRADAEALRAAPSALLRLQPLSACAEEKALRSPLRPPADPATAARVEALRAELAEVVAVRAAGGYGEAGRRVAALEVKAAELKFRPLQAEVSLLEGQVKENLEDFAGAEESLQKALLSAEAGAHLARAAEAWALLVRLQGGKKGARYAEAHRSAAHAAALIERLGRAPSLEALLARNLGDLLLEEGKPTEAIVQLTRALELREALDPESVEVAATLNALGDAVRATGENEASLGYHQRALALLTARLGPSHPDVALVMKNIGNVYWRKSDLDPALEWYRRALKVQLEALPPDSFEVASTRNNVAAVYIRQQKLGEAEAELRRVLPVWERKLGDEHPRLYGVLNNLAVALRYQGRFDEAEAALRRALAIAEKAHGKEHDDVATTLLNLGDLLLAKKAFADSLAVYQRASAITEKRLGPNHTNLAECLGGEAYPLLQLKEYRRALEATTRALAIFEAGEGIPLVVAQVHFAHAQALWELEPSRRAAAVQEAAAANKALAGAGAQDSERSEVEAWLKTHR